TAFDPRVTAAIEGALVLLMAATLRAVVRPVRSGCGTYRVLPSFPINVSLGDDQPDGNSDARRVRGRSRLTAGLDVPARARAHARHPGADARKRFEVDAEARRELEPGRARAVGDREGADDILLPLELSVENVQDLRHALPPALEDLLVPL